MDILDGNSAARLKHEEDEDRKDREQAMIEAAAEKGCKHYLEYLCPEDITLALEGLTGDELYSLCEDCGGPMRDGPHAGSIVLQAVRRYCFQMAVKDEQERIEAERGTE